MANIKTLKDDIYGFLTNKKEVSDANLDLFLEGLRKLIKYRLEHGDEQEFSLRMSNLGEKCDRKQWLMKHHPDKIERIPPHVKLKFLYGDLIEHLILYLAREAGHEVKKEQAEIEIDGVKGHPDAIIDGHLVDVKSTTSFGLKKFKEGGLKFDDPFNYLDQLGAYLFALRDDEDLEVKKEASYVAVDKALGHIEVATYKFPDKDFHALTKRKKEVLESSEIPPRFYQPVALGKSGNLSLPVSCSYCPVKAACWPGLRTFLYAGGPKFLCHVEVEPDVPEVGNEWSGE